jgi:hypothetical protein
MVDEMTDALLGIAEVEEDRLLDTLAPQRTPEALDLAQRLRPARRRHDLADAALVELLGEGALAAPGHVLAAVVGQDLLGAAVGRQRRPQHLHDQSGGLTGVQPVADDEAAVVIQKGDQVDASVLPLEDEGEQVGLPELVGPGALEVADVVGMRPGGDFFQLIAGLMQDARHGGSAGRQGRTAQQQVTDLLATPVGVGLLEQQDGAYGQLGQAAARGPAAGLVHQAAWPLRVKLLLPGIQGVLGEADQGGEVAGRQLAALPGIQQEQALLRGVIRAGRSRGHQPLAAPSAPAVATEAPTGGRGGCAAGTGCIQGFGGRVRERAAARLRAGGRGVHGWCGGAGQVGACAGLRGHRRLGLGNHGIM